jgi:hypothetical protein
MIQALIPALAPILSRVASNLFPDPEAKAKAESEMALALLASQKELEAAAASIVKAEASSTNWLASSWRPIVMLTFAGLIVARWFGWAAPNLSEAEYLKLWSIVELGLGGYVIGRSAEKIIPGVAEALKK